MTCIIKLIGDRILVKLDEVRDTSDGGIVLSGNLPEASKPHLMWGTVTQLGTDEKRLSELSIGTRVLVESFGGATIPWELKGRKIYNRNDIVAIEE